MSSEGASGEGDDDGDAGEPLFREHKLSKTDSLASIAIRYGVTTRDIKRANGGVITDATLHARASLRIPRTSLAEGAPLPGGGGVSGAAKPIATKQAAMTPALAKMREYYGTAKREESPPPETSGRAGTERDGGEAQHAFAGGAQVAKKIARTASHGNLDNHPDAAEPVASSSADRSTHEGGGSKYGSALSGGAMPATAFQGRDRALMSPPKPPSGPPARGGRRTRGERLLRRAEEVRSRAGNAAAHRRVARTRTRVGELWKPSSIRERRCGCGFRWGRGVEPPGGAQGERRLTWAVCVPILVPSKVKRMISSLARDARRDGESNASCDVRVVVQVCARLVVDANASLSLPLGASSSYRVGMVHGSSSSRCATVLESVSPSLVSRRRLLTLAFSSPLSGAW